MTVGELIKRLGEFDPEMVVCLADWNEAYRKPNEGAAESLKVVTEEYRNVHWEMATGQFLKIGEGDF